MRMGVEVGWDPKQGHKSPLEFKAQLLESFPLLLWQLPESAPSHNHFPGNPCLKSLLCHREPAKEKSHREKGISAALSQPDALKSQNPGHIPEPMEDAEGRMRLDPPHQCSSAPPGGFPMDLSLWNTTGGMDRWELH